jgi:hypothetical protein
MNVSFLGKPKSPPSFTTVFNLQSDKAENEVTEVTGGSEIELDELTPIPLSQTNFFPDLIHVKVLPPTTEVVPSGLHEDPALTAAFTGIKGRDTESESIDKKAMNLLFIRKV